MRGVWIALVILFGSAAVATAAAARPPLIGTWLVESATREPAPAIVRGRLTLTDRTFALVGYNGLDRPWTGTYTRTADGSLDLHADAYDVGNPGHPLVVPAASVRALCKVDPKPDGDRLTVRFAMHADQPRPSAFSDVPPAATDGPRQVVFVRVADGFAFPDAVTVKVVDPAGHAAVGAELFATSVWQRQGKLSADGKSFAYDMKTPSRWGYRDVATTGPDGTARLPYAAFDGQLTGVSGARDAAGRSMAAIAPSAAALRTGTLTVQLQPTRLVRGALTCDAMRQPGRYFMPTVTLNHGGDDALATYLSDDGTFAIPLPTGAYELMGSGFNVHLLRQTIDVPPGTGDVLLPPIAMDASEGLDLVGRPAPPLQGVLGWKGTPVDLASLRGRVVLLNFWGYWCGNCTAEMPVLMRLQDRYASLGLSVVGVHVDAGGEVTTAAELDWRTAGFRSGFWGRDLPFPVALTSGRPVGHSRGLNGSVYGVLSYPTTVVIGRDGRVLGQAGPGSLAKLDLTDDAAAAAAVEALLAAR